MSKNNTKMNKLQDIRQIFNTKIIPISILASKNMFTWSVLLVSSTLRPMARLLMVECWIIPSLSIMKSPLNAIPYHDKTKLLK